MGAFAGFVGNSGVKKAAKWIGGKFGKKKSDGGSSPMDGGGSSGGSDSGGGGFYGSGVTSYHKGGRVRKTGLARIKKGERVLTKGQQKKLKKRMRSK